ncbi:MAG: phosphotransferase [Acidimicrobiia bacterium]|nr:phosphotransferase [Acidimicrobiia bacterium]
MSSSAPDTERIAGALARDLGGSVRVVDLRRLSGGASRETWSFDAVDERGTTLGLVLRRDPGSHTGQSERSTEYRLLEAAENAGVPVPPVRLLLEPADGLGSGFVMDRVEGETMRGGSCETTPTPRRALVSQSSAVR